MKIKIYFLLTLNVNIPIPIPIADPTENTNIASISLRKVLLAPANSNPKQNPITNLWEATAPTNKNTWNAKFIKIINHISTINIKYNNKNFNWEKIFHKNNIEKYGYYNRYYNLIYNINAIKKIFLLYLC